MTGRFFRKELTTLPEMFPQQPWMDKPNSTSGGESSYSRLHSAFSPVDASEPPYWTWSLQLFKTWMCFFFVLFFLALSTEYKTRRVLVLFISWDNFYDWLIGLLLTCAPRDWVGTPHWIVIELRCLVSWTNAILNLDRMTLLVSRGGGGLVHFTHL